MKRIQTVQEAVDFLLTDDGQDLLSAIGTYSHRAPNERIRPGIYRGAWEQDLGDAGVDPASLDLMAPLIDLALMEYDRGYDHGSAGVPGEVQSAS